MSLLTSLAVAAQLLAAQPPAAQPPDSGPRFGPLRPAPLHVTRAGADAPDVVADTLRRPRPRAIEYSDWYSRRATIHKWGSFTMLPLFAAQYYTGSRLMERGADAPALARRAHGPVATGVAALFAVNTVTGVWNLWEARHDPDERTRRIAHAILMLTADAGFAATGLLADEAEGSGDARDRHRAVALASVGTALAGYALMVPPLRRE